MPFIVVETSTTLSEGEKVALREALTAVFSRLNTPSEVTGVAISATGYGGGGRSLAIITAMQPRPPETLAALEGGFAEITAGLGYELRENRFIQVLPEDWPQPSWAKA